MLRIVHVIPGLTVERGGPTEVLRALPSYQLAQGHEVTILTTDQGARRGERPVEAPAAACVHQANVRGPDRLAFAPGFPALLHRCIRVADIVHVHSTFTYPVHAALRVAMRSNVPVVLRPCGHLHPYGLGRSRWRKRFYLFWWGGMVRRACSAWHYTSSREARESWPRDDSPRFVLPNGVEPDRFALDRDAARDAVRSRWPQIGMDPYVLYLGRIHPKKRLDLLLEGFLSAAPRDHRLVVAGPDECGLWARLQERLLRHGPDASRIVRLGTVDGEEKPLLLAGARLFALPSEHENFGISAVESLAAGTPVLLSPEVDVAPPIVQAQLGRTASLRTQEWAEGIVDLLRPNPLGPSFPERARAWVREHFAWDRIAARLTERYRWVIDGCH